MKRVYYRGRSPVASLLEKPRDGVETRGWRFGGADEVGSVSLTGEIDERLPED